MRRIEFVLGIKAQNSQNARMHHMQRARLTKAQRDRASLGLRMAAGFLEIRPLLRVTLTRVGPRALDSDNLAGTLKAVRDGIAARLRIDDGSPLVEWVYRQESEGPGVYAVKVAIEAVGPFDAARDAELVRKGAA